MPSNVTITPTNSARNLGVIFDSSLTFSEHISSVSKSCFLSIRDLRRIRNTLDYSSAQTIATSFIHSKVDYSNSLFLNLPRCQLDRLQLILNSAALDVSKTPCYRHISPILKYLHWLKIDQRIQYKVLYDTYKTLQSQKPSYLYSLLNLQPNTSTRSSTVITLQHPPVNSRLKITDRSFTSITSWIFFTRSDWPALIIRVDPPLISDHSFIVAHLSQMTTGFQSVDQASPVTLVRIWHVCRRSETVATPHRPFIWRHRVFWLLRHRFHRVIGQTCAVAFDQNPGPSVCTLVRRRVSFC